jgi:hypothetical protein
MLYSRTVSSNILKISRLVFRVSSIQFKKSIIFQERRWISVCNHNTKPTSLAALELHASGTSKHLNFTLMLFY